VSHRRDPAFARPDRILQQSHQNIDSFMIVSGEYNHSIPPALKNLLDHFLEEWFWR
jgi:NAD(P)H-dependent FMN reductase